MELIWAFRCAIGALYEIRKHPHLPAPLSEFFSAKAKIWLEVELDSPRVATVQALVLMSSYEAARTRDARGWLYSGKLMRRFLHITLQYTQSRSCQTYNEIIKRK